MDRLEDEAPPGRALSATTGRLVASLRRAAGAPPAVIAQRLRAEVDVELNRVRAPRRGRRFTDAELCRATGSTSVDSLWETVLSRPYPFVRTSGELARLEERWPDERGRVVEAARRALAHEIDLLGTGPVALGSPIDWHRDWKTGRTWPLRYGRRLAVAELERPSDVKVPWEISRLQWLLPAGQAYLLTGDESFAAGARSVLEDWIAGNPYALGVNWAIAMEPALRVLSWTWLLHACGGSRSWHDGPFRSAFARSLFLHAEFVERNLERRWVNGNHYTANAAGLVVAGLVLGVRRWSDDGWAILRDELPRQVHADGVDFEASAAYHRLVGELFALPALLRRAHGLQVEPAHVDRLRAMAVFTAAYTRPDGLAPAWGDADDGRALPLGGQPPADHRSFPVLVAALAGTTAAGNAEGAWLAGPDAVADASEDTPSAAFRDGGAFVLRGGEDHVFVDCGPVGLAGRGGHGHNDCLSFEAVLGGVPLVCDPGTFVYTASPEWRNRFRSTAAHNTPVVDREEQNRIEPMQLWTLSDDAAPEVRAWSTDGTRSCVEAAHGGYRRLAEPVTPVRAIELDAARHRLEIHDRFEGSGEHLVEVPLQLAPGVSAAERAPGAVALSAGGKDFLLTWEPAAEWALAIGSGWVSPSYGVKVEAGRLVWSRRGTLAPLVVSVEPTA